MTEKELKNSWDKLDSLLASLSHIHEIGSFYSARDSKTNLCQAVLENACHLTNSSRGTLMLLDEATGQLAIVASKGFPENIVAQTRLRPGEGIAGMAFERGEPISTAVPSRCENYVGYTGAPEQNEPFIAYPVKTRDRIIGVLNLHAAREADIVNEYNLKLLSVLSGKAAITLENLHMHSTLQSFYLEMVETLTRVIDAKDSYTHDHAGRARKKARSIADALALPEQAALHVEYAALLHDIGKIGISENILLKPGRLSDNEYLDIKRHPRIGYEILSPVAFLNQVARMVLYHQEWYNGGGYPEGLSGDAIPLGSRIVSVIDAWDAMVSDRPYRKAMSRESAVAELKRGAGLQFDPKIVAAFLRLEEQGWSA